MQSRTGCSLSLSLILLLLCAGCPGGGTTGGGSPTDLAASHDAASTITDMPPGEGGTADLLSSGDGGGCAPFGAGQAACTNCLRAMCASDFSTCYGPNWYMNDFSGTCKDYTACACKCPDDNCKLTCLQNAGMACQQCAAQSGNCLQKYCSSQCGK